MFGNVPGRPWLIILAGCCRMPSWLYQGMRLPNQCVSRDSYMLARREKVCPRTDFVAPFQASEKERLGVKRKVLSVCCPIFGKISCQSYCTVRVLSRMKDSGTAVTLRVVDWGMRVCACARRSWAFTYFAAVFRNRPNVRLANHRSLFRAHA